MNKTHVTLICGGIGSGKSIVSRIVATLGYAVYDTDSQARRIMDSSPEILAAIEKDVCPGCIVDGVLNRQTVAQVVFKDKKRLELLNEIVHGAVRDDIRVFAEAHSGERVFVETAIPNTGCLCDMVDDVWVVTAPESVRIERVMKRNGLDAKQVKARIDSQRADEEPCHNNLTTIVNDNTTAVVPQVLELLKREGA